jgi:hypothetical protein
MYIMEELKYPIGHYSAPAHFTSEILNKYISVIELFPQKIKQETTHLSEEQLDTPYRPQGWTVCQVVNHCADSHMNALIRVKLALTEDIPTIKPYMEARWAELADGTMPIQSSFQILEGVHKRWSTLLKSLSEKEWKKHFVHPEKGKELSLEESTGSYAWHCDHHLAHITRLKERMGWK